MRGARHETNPETDTTRQHRHTESLYFEQVQYTNGGGAYLSLVGFASGSHIICCKLQAISLFQIPKLRLTCEKKTHMKFFSLCHSEPMSNGWSLRSPAQGYDILPHGGEALPLMAIVACVLSS